MDQAQPLRLSQYHVTSGAAIINGKATPNSSRLVAGAATSYVAPKKFRPKNPVKNVNGKPRTVTIVKTFITSFRRLDTTDK
jgi:hypothetical protein